MRLFIGLFSAILAVLLALIAACMPTVASAAEDAEPAATALDQYGKPLAAGVLARLSGARYLHPCPLYAWAYSPDGKTLVSLAEDQLVRFWNTADGRLAHAIEPPPVVIVPWPGQLSFSRDGGLLAVAYGSMCIRIIDAAERKVLHDIRELRPDVVRDGWQTVEFVGRGSLLLAGSEKTSYWIDPETGKVKDRKHLGRFEVRAAAANVTAFADGERVIEFCRCNAANPDRISLYPGRLSYPHPRGPGQSGSLLPRGGQTLALSPDGEFIAAAGVELVRKWGLVEAQHPTTHIDIYEI
ncbi:MAG TPA: WD40 repeat domain-containing protein, partial [Pirellulales bacterium]|nr:WD40 repeat domain-containing protein [Pirellulales bacterium]